MDLSIVIPCYNEVDNVPKLQRELVPVAIELAKTRLVEIIFIDDGSSDGTGQALINTLGTSQGGVAVRVEHHKVNQGLGAAIRTGLKASQGDIVVTTDSDGTYQFSEIPALLSYLTPGVDIVTASPYHPAGGVMDVPLYRLFFSRGASAVYRLLAARRIHTYTALFRAYRRDVTEHVSFESNGFLAGTELLVNAIRMGYQVTEYPTVLHSRVLGESKAKLARTVKAHLNYQLSTLRPWFPYGTVIKGSGNSVFLYTQQQKCLFPSAEIFLSHGYHWEQIAQVTDKFLAQIPDGPSMNFRTGVLVRGTDHTVYAIEHGKKREFCSASVFKELGYRWNNVIQLPQKIIAGLETGPTIDSSTCHPDGTLVKSPADTTVYLLESSQKRRFLSVQVFLSWGYRWQQVITISESELAKYPEGLPVVAQEEFCLEDRPELVEMNSSYIDKLVNKLLSLGMASLVLIGGWSIAISFVSN